MAKKRKRQVVRKAKKPKPVDRALEVVMELAGNDVLPLVRVLRKKSNVSEFRLADALDQEINTVRNMLYRLYDHNLVAFSRKKDKKKGWYIYYWTFNPGRAKELLVQLNRSRLERLRERIGRERSTNFFSCANKCIRLDFDQAVEFEYKCPECGEILYQEDNAAKIAELEKECQQLLKSAGRK
jgi:transcription initiation factor TFIIE subunit alpha